MDDLHLVVYSEVQPQPKTQGEATSAEPTLERACDTGDYTQLVISVLILFIGIFIILHLILPQALQLVTV